MYYIFSRITANIRLASRLWRFAICMLSSAIGIVSLLRNVANGAQYLRIRSAPAQVSAHRLANLVVGGFAHVREQCMRGDELARRAKAALRSIVCNEGGLERRKRFTVRQPFDRGDVCAVARARESQAGIDQGAVEQHRAGAALPAVAATLGAGERKFVA